MKHKSKQASTNRWQIYKKNSHSIRHSLFHMQTEKITANVVSKRWMINCCLMYSNCDDKYSPIASHAALNRPTETGCFSKRNSMTTEWNKNQKTWRISKMENIARVKLTKSVQRIYLSSPNQLDCPTPLYFPYLCADPPYFAKAPSPSRIMGLLGMSDT